MAYFQSVFSCLSAAILLLFLISVESRYEPTWESLDSRPLPGWFDEAKVGIFLHWGVFSVPSYGSAWFWYYWKRQGVKSYVDFMKNNYPPDFTYADFAPQFKAEFYDAKKWANIFKDSGAKYVVLVSKHHEGFTLWPSKHSWNWNAMDVGPKQDLVAPLASAVKAEGMHFGVYHSLYEWFNPLYMADKASGYKTQNFVRDKTMPELYELVNNYKPDLIWSDGQWEADSSYWNSTQFLAWLYNDSPVNKTVVVNDRWGKDTTCKHGGYFNCNDRYNPGVLQKKKWENAMTIDKTAWTYVRNKQLSDFLTMEELLKTMAETVSCGGNILINVGPTPDGRIVPIFEERLRQLGSWLKVNGEAIYATKPWSAQNDTKTPNIWYTSKPGTHGHTSVYAIVLDWPQGSSLTLGPPTPSSNTVVTLLGYPAPIKWQKTGSSGIEIMVPVIPINKMPCLWAWVFKMVNLAK